jgi:hypothetical protein
MVGFFIYVVDLFLICCLAVAAAGLGGLLLLRRYPQHVMYWLTLVWRLMGW